MKRLKLLFIGLCLAVISVQAQVVFSEDEKNFVVSQVTTPIQNAATTFTTNHGASCLKFKPSGILDNWFVSARTGAAAFAGSPSGCGDLFDRVTPNLEITVGKWHTPYFGTRIAFDGFKFKTANLNKERYENYHLDLMLNISSFYHKDYEKIPKWNFVPYMGAGVIHNSLLHKTEFAINYGVLCSYRIADRLSLSAEVGAMATAQKFDGLGTGSSLRDNLFRANLGLTIDIGKQGWKKKSLKTVPYYHCNVPTEVSFYPKNNYRGLNELRERIKSIMSSGDVILDKNIDVPILFFFKINSTDFIDNQQKIELSEIAAAVKEYNLKVKVIGAADSRTGSNEYNRKLSIKRAKYIAKLLIDAGVQKEKLQGVSQGGIDIYKPYTANRHTCVILSKDNSSLENKLDMTLLRRNSNLGSYDIAPQLQATLNANGMQAHLSQTPSGEMQLITLAHNSSTPRYYTLTQSQVENLRSGGTNSFNRKAYETFTSIVKNDYYMPNAWVTAKNANSPVNMGQWGHTIMDGEYGYREPKFHPFMGARYGKFNSFMDRLSLLPQRGYHVRRIEGRHFFASSAPVVVDRPDGRLKPGELKSGAYGFYDKGTQVADPLHNLEIHSKPRMLARPKGQAEPLDKAMGSTLYATPELFQQILASHGVVIDDKNKTLTIKSSSVNKNLQYNLSNEELSKLMAENFKDTGKQGNKDKNVVSIDERISIINKVIENDFAGKITRQMLNSKDYVDIKLKPEAEKEIFIAQDAMNAHQKHLDIITLGQQRTDYHTGYIDRWNSIGVVDGRMLSENKAFYLPVKDGRRVSVGEIQTYPTHDGEKTSFRMTAVINNEVMSHEISKEDYIKFINYDDEHRLELFDKVFDEVKIKDASNGKNEDHILSGNLETAKGVVSMKGNYSLTSDNTKALITSAMVWKDQISGNYLLNLRDSSDVGMWAFKISEKQYQDFSNATDDERAKMLAQLIPITDDKGSKLAVVKELTLPQSRAEQNLNSGYSNERIAKILKQRGFSVDSLSQEDIKKLILSESKSLGDISLSDLQRETKLTLLGDAKVNGEGLENLKSSKEWRRSGEHGRATEVSDIAVERLKDADGKVIEGKYKMSAVIDGNVFSHEITQKEYDKFLAVNDMQRMKLFDKIFPEVKMCTKEGHGFNLGAAILAAVTTGLDVAASLSRPAMPRPDIYEHKGVYFKPGVVSPAEVAAAKFENFNHEAAMSRGEGRGLGI